MTTTTAPAKKDARIDLWERLIANAQITRQSKKTDAVTAKLATDLEVEFSDRLGALKQELQLVKEAA